MFTSSYNKNKGYGSSTPWILSIFADLFSEDRREDFLHHCEMVKGNRLSFVPKTAVIDRAICVEPRWNVFLQLGIGGAITQRLADYGLDLHDQTRNRELARLAHVFGLATIDLSSASDTVSKLLIEFLLPEDWADYVFKSRSPQTLYKGKWYQLEKVSSMGNGFTFPLESLVFLGLCEAACSFYGEPPCIGVYGDDLIVPQTVAPQLIELLSYAGFSVNPTKSFISGDFFESCGHDYYKGVNVRPFFIKRKVSSILDYMILANQISEYSRRLPNVGHALDFRSLWSSVVGAIPKRVRLLGPVGLSGVVHASLDAATPVRAPHGWEGWMLDTWVAVPVRYNGFDYQGHLFSKLSDDIDTGNGFTTRSSVRWKRKKTYVPTYGDFLWL
jgi:hypothetical protein